MRRQRVVILAAVVLLLGTARSAAAQQVHAAEDALSDANITVRIYGPDNRPLKQQAFVTLYQRGSTMQLGTVMTTVSSEAVLTGMPGYGPYTVTVSASGYQTASRDFEYDLASGRVEVDVIMHPLAGAGGAAAVPVPLDPKTQAHVDKGLEAMKAGKFQDAQKELNEAHKVAPENSNVCYLLGAAYQKGNDLKSAQTYLEKATSIDPDNVQALVALGQLHDQQKNYKAAIASLEKAATLDKSQWLARWVLSDAYLRTGQYEKAARSAQAAVELANGAANKAELIEGEALAQLGRRDEAIKALQGFLRDLPGDPAAPAVRALITRLQSAPESPRKPGSN
ncbi:MAG TPA: tetratricopeptide repeat protein [Candidatus Acidoferrum sp.]|nr:tetratricopeptide repeat protein [Candidatus Acidoferrum sp.]